ncbi:nmrA-like family domain-containing protein 1 [Gigantopelta aegis]|uniref:nmrA-like family domain-containing protein 1 n=1 Tax=Gigantopelta aegis TaxID=1735272 RepID=UPI001B88866A|nr:nmrA-like family domain-containing protein 1 [Gigantopelta aegis]XP_041361731.1 nmrA-like family domain-containing protein 1 [Gigantopelta aegis]XP_041361732.1 nmrA-like family domain-containing protein 1 [Gigantopelta aegis]
MGSGTSGSRKKDVKLVRPVSVVVFGATGMIGGSVARTLSNSQKFKVTVVTRNPSNSLIRRLEKDGAEIRTADLNDPKSLVRVVHGADAMFLVTHYWEHLSKRSETQQGMNAVYAAIKCNIKHLVFYGAESCVCATGQRCGYMDAKAAIEEYIKGTGLPYTILRASFFYENFLSIFKPHNIGDNVFVIG